MAWVQAHRSSRRTQQRGRGAGAAARGGGRRGARVDSGAPGSLVGSRILLLSRGVPVEDVQPFGLLVLVVAAVGLLAVLSNRLSERLQVPTPAFFLAGAAIAAQVIPGLDAPPHQTVERLVTVALVVILFDGGMHIGWRRFRQAAAPIASAGVIGTFLTTAAIAVLAHYAF